MNNTDSNKTTPAWIRFAAALRGRLAQMGLTPLTAQTESGFPQNKGYFFVRFGHDQAAAMIVPKSERTMGNVHLHIDLKGSPGYVKPVDNNGRVVCHYQPDLDLICQHVIPRLPGAEKRAVRVASRPASGETVAPPVGDVFGQALADHLALADGAAELASWADVEELEPAALKIA